jgi:hypothetical protein
MTPQAGAVSVPGAPSINPNIGRKAAIQAAAGVLPYSWQQQEMIKIQREGQKLARQQMETEQKASRANLWMQGAGLGYRIAGGEEGLAKRGWDWANKPITEPIPPKYSPSYYGTRDNLSFPTEITPDSGLPIPEYTPPFTSTRQFTPPITESFLTKTPSGSLPLGTIESTMPTINKTAYMQPLSRSYTPTEPLSKYTTYKSPTAPTPALSPIQYGASALSAYGVGSTAGKLAGQALRLRGKPQQTTAEISGGALGGALTMGATTGYNPYAMVTGAILGSIGAKNPLKGRAAKTTQYAGYGATIGSFVPVPGATLIGAGIGAVIGRFF